MSVRAIIPQIVKITDAGGDPVPGAKAYFYRTGTSTPLTVYSDAAATVAHSSPLVADSAGILPSIFIAENVEVKIDVYTAADVQVAGYPIDPMVGVVATSRAASDITFTPTTEVTSTDVQAAIAALGVKSSRYFYAGDYGDNTTPGTTDVQSAAQSAVNAAAAAGGGVVVLYPGEACYFGSPVLVSNSNILIDATGCRITCAATMGSEVQFDLDAVIRFVGSTSATTTLSANAAVAAESITVASASGISAGDVLYFSNTGNRWYTENATQIDRTHINRVRSVSGSTITLQMPLPRSLDATTYTCNVTAYTGLQNVGVIGGHWDGGGFDHNVGNGRGTAAAFFNYCQDVVFRPEYAGGFSGAQCWLSNTFGFDVNIPRMRGHNDGYTDAIVEGNNSGFYGVYALQCRAGTMRINAASNTRHATDGARTEDVTVTGTHAYNNHQTPFTTHSGCDDWKYLDCSATGPQGFLSWRGFNLTVDSCRCYSPNAAEGFIYDLPGTANDLQRRYVISNCDAVTAREPIRLNSKCEATISNCVLENTDGGAYGSIYLGEDVEVFTFMGGILRSSSAAGSDQLVTGALTPRARETVRFIGTKFENYADNALQLNAVVNETSLTVLEAEFDSQQGATAHVLLGSDAYRRVLVEGSNVDGTQYSLGRENSYVPKIGTATVDFVLDAASMCSWSRYGNRVFITGDIRVTSLNSATAGDAVVIKDLPLDVAADPEAFGGGMVTWFSGMGLATASTITIRALSPGVTEAGMYTSSTAGSITLKVSECTASSRFVISISYITDDP